MIEQIFVFSRQSKMKDFNVSTGRERGNNSPKSDFMLNFNLCQYFAIEVEIEAMG